MSKIELKPPESLCLQGNVAENWRTWKQRFDNYLLATESDKKSDAVKIALLLTCMGPEALDRYNHFDYTEGEDKTKYKTVLQKFDIHFQGMKRTVFCRYQFWTHQRGI